MPQFVKHFLLVLLAAFASSALGAGFGSLIAVLSPEFVHELLEHSVEAPIRYAGALGMICGLLLGTAVMSFCILVSAAGHWFRGSAATRT